MSYQDQAALSRDAAFNARSGAALAEEGRVRIAEPLGKLVMNSPTHGTTVFMPFLASAPGFGTKYAAGGQVSITDADILSAVQASWADVATVQFPA